MQGAPESVSRSWEARLDLRLAASAGRTVVADRLHRGPLQVQRPFYPEGHELCHLYLLHPPGGLVAGDSLAVEVRVGRGARALVTTPAAAKVYRNDGGAAARQRHTLAIEPAASLEWLPQETILFDGARVSLDTIVELEPEAVFIGWEIVCLGRPACREPFARGACRTRFELRREGRPLCIERTFLDGGDPVMSQPWGLGGACVFGTLYATPAAPDRVADVRALAAELPPGDSASATVVEGALVCRYLGGDTGRAREHFERIWTALRPDLCGRPGRAPRIWLT